MAAGPHHCTGKIGLKILALHHDDVIFNGDYSLHHDDVIFNGDYSLHHDDVIFALQHIVEVFGLKPVETGSLQPSRVTENSSLVSEHHVPVMFVMVMCNCNISNNYSH